MTITKERAQSFESYDDLRGELMTPGETAAQDAAVARELAALRSMQDSISQAVTSFMALNEIGFNELTRRLKTSSRQSSKIIKAEANLTLATIAELAALMGKKARIVFDEEESA